MKRLISRDFLDMFEVVLVVQNLQDFWATFLSRRPDGRTYRGSYLPPPAFDPAHKGRQHRLDYSMTDPNNCPGAAGLAIVQVAGHAGQCRYLLPAHVSYRPLY